jgi:bifunctional DNA-binding transcriptional regulator/antitoxin component of YhaV-PrlF toxin-antitoxin module
MAITRSRVTAQGHISVHSDVCRKLGVGPGSVLEWDEDGVNIVVRRAGRYSSEDIHRVLFGEQALVTRSVEDLKEGIKRIVRQRNARI